MSVKDQYWLSVSALLSATVFVVGGAPAPMIFFLGAVIILGLLFTGLIFGQLKRVKPKKGTGSAVLPLLGFMVILYAAILLRGTTISFVATPVLAIVMGTGSFIWAHKRGPFIHQN
ncbi:hypothetical protein QFZ52_001841 [Arthrobacter woluwensis]|uniref:hypothetical protein n=1 Tax=Arthrobacter woluwensis TaxID=156980 RepID=UPI002788FBE0|nr:hypothetical protein [Arthrobacter woluwensis]MDQ0709189.1 hypothetical protein [Arthrobacter woluwensis]